GSFRQYDGLSRRVRSTRPNPRNVVNYSDYAVEEPPDESRPQRRPQNRLPRQFRFNWRSPLLMSPHSPSTLYLAGNHLFRSVDGGERWMIVSPDLSSNDPAKTDIQDPGGLTRDSSGAETHCAITALSESPLVPGLIWAGSDDGQLHVTRNGGAEWTEAGTNIPDMPPGLWVSSVEASHFDPGAAFVAFDGHRSDDWGVWIFKTQDYGKSWRSIRANIPDGQVLYVVRQDYKNSRLLFAGSEFALFASLDGGQSWQRFMNGLPTVAIHDLVIHPRDGDLVAGTHGRGIWILDDITPLQELDDEVLAGPAYLFEPRPATIWEDASRGGVRGQFPLAAPNPPSIPPRDDVVRAKLINGASFSYYLKSPQAEPVEIEITDLVGESSRTLIASAGQGIHRVQWDLRFDLPDERVKEALRNLRELVGAASGLPYLSQQQSQALQRMGGLLANAADLGRLQEATGLMRDHFGQMSIFRRAFRGLPRGQLAEPGRYRIVLRAGGKEYSRILNLRQDPILEGG
ncbi:MAG: hypothetical protein V3T83_05725, partial [Acidobacteriota bacterium]